MARPKSNELTERELELMQVFWEHGDLTTAEVQAHLEGSGRELAYTTVATLVKILQDKKCIQQTNEKRPFSFKPVRTFDEVSGSIVGDLIKRVFGGSREQLLIRMMSQKKLTKRERAALEEILREKK